MDIGLYARPTPINISTLMIRRPFDSNCDRRDFTSSRTACRSRLGQGKINLWRQSHPGLDRIPILVEAANRIFPLHPFYSNLTEACGRKHVFQLVRIGQC